MGSNAGAYPTQNQDYYPTSNSFPPPPTNDYAARDVGYPAGEYPPEEYPPGEYPAYNPADYPPPPGATPQPGGIPDPYDPSNAHHHQNQAGYAGPNETFAGDARYETGHHGGRAGPENVSPRSRFGAYDDYGEGDHSRGEEEAAASDEPQGGFRFGMNNFGAAVACY